MAGTQKYLTGRVGCHLSVKIIEAQFKFFVTTNIFVGEAQYRIPTNSATELYKQSLMEEIREDF